MKMTTRTEPAVAELEPVTQGPGYVANKTSLVVFDSATEAQVLKAFSQIVRMDKAIAWWLGDLGIAIQDRKQRQLAHEAAELRRRANECTTDADGMQLKSDLLERAQKLETKGVIEYTRDLCALHDVSESHLKHCVMWARFYQPCHRWNGLSPKHHDVAMIAAGGAGGDVEKAVELLKSAADRGLKASELRKEVNIAQAVYAKPEPDPEPLSYDDLIAADHWAVAHKGEIKAMSIEQALRVYTLIQGIREYVDELRRRLQPGG